MKAQILTKTQLQTLAPAAFAQGRDEARTSDRYAFTSTDKVMDMLAECGWHAHSAHQMRTRSRTAEHQKHLVRLFNPTITTPDHMPELLLFNSHNGLSTLKFMAGVFRFACANGLVLPESVSGSMVARHVGNIEADLIEIMKQHAKQIEITMGAIDKMRSVELAPAQQLQLADTARILKFGDEPVKVDSRFFLRARRWDDNGNDAWRVFNRVQENLLRGGVRGTNVETNARVHTKIVTGIDENLRLNRGIFDAALKLVA